MMIWAATLAPFVVAAFFQAPTEPKLSTGVTPREREVLLALYEATGGSQWTHRRDWLGPPGTECSECRRDCFERVVDCAQPDGRLGDAGRIAGEPVGMPLSDERLVLAFYAPQRGARLELQRRVGAPNRVVHAHLLGTSMSPKKARRSAFRRTLPHPDLPFLPHLPFPPRY